MHIRFNKIDGFLKVYDGTRYLVLLGSEKHDSISDRIRYLISVKSCITYIISYNFANIKVDSCYSLPLERKTLHNVMILVKPVLNKDKNNYYCNIFLEQASYELSKNFCINNLILSKWRVKTI